MGTSISQMVEELMEITAWQATPEPLTYDQYVQMIIHGIRRLYIDTNRPELFDRDLISVEDGETIYNADIPQNEQYYALLCAQIEFFKKVQSDVNNIVGYTTNALTVTNADKPYANLKDSIAGLENERRIVYYKMVAYTLGE